MNLTIDMPGFYLTFNDERNEVRLVDKRNASGKTCSVADFAKLIQLGVRADLSNLP